MNQRRRIYYSTAQRAEIWIRIGLGWCHACTYRNYNSANWNGNRSAMSIIGRQSRTICAFFLLVLSACSVDQFVDAIDEDARVTCDVLERRDGILEAIRMTAAKNGFTFYDGPVPEDRTQIVVSMDRGPAAVEFRNSGLDSIWINSSVISLSETDIYDGKDIDLVVEELVAAIEEVCET